MRIIVDLDETIMDVHSHFEEMINSCGYSDESEYELEFCKSSITDYDYYECLPVHLAEFIMSLWSAGNLYQRDGVSPFKDSIDVLENLRERGHEIVIATVPMEGHVKSKLKWLNNHSSIYDSYVMVDGNKDVLDGDILIDDCPHYISDKFTNILIDKPYNEDCDGNYIRVFNWAQIHARILLEAHSENREPVRLT